jgi:hypothetical protein
MSPSTGRAAHSRSARVGRGRARRTRGRAAQPSSRDRRRAPDSSCNRRAQCNWPVTAVDCQTQVSPLAARDMPRRPAPRAVCDCVTHIRRACPGGHLAHTSSRAAHCARRLPSQARHRACVRATSHSPPSAVRARQRACMHLPRPHCSTAAAQAACTRPPLFCTILCRRARRHAAGAGAKRSAHQTRHDAPHTRGLRRAQRTVVLREVGANISSLTD